MMFRIKAPFNSLTAGIACQMFCVGTPLGYAFKHGEMKADGSRKYRQLKMAIELKKEAKLKKKGPGEYCGVAE